MRGSGIGCESTYHKPVGGFLAIGPRYPGEIVDGGTAVRFCHHGAPEWTEVVPIEDVEEAPTEPPRRRRWK